MAEIVVAFVERLAERETLDLEACGEFLVLVVVSARAQGSRALPRRGGRPLRAQPRRGRRGARSPPRGVPPDQGGRGSGSRLVWSTSPTATSGSVLRRCPGSRATPGPAASRRSRPGDAYARGRAAAGLARAHGLALPAYRAFPRAFSRGAAPAVGAFMLDSELDGPAGLEQAAAFLALLELRKANEVRIEQAAPFAPIRVSRPDVERSSDVEQRSPLPPDHVRPAGAPGADGRGAARRRLGAAHRRGAGRCRRRRRSPRRVGARAARGAVPRRAKRHRPRARRGRLRVPSGPRGSGCVRTARRAACRARAVAGRARDPRGRRVSRARSRDPTLPGCEAWPRTRSSRVSSSAVS